MPCVGRRATAVREHMSAHSRPAHGHLARERGVALVLALWLTVLLTVLAGTFAFDMRSEALAARNAVSLAQARAISDGVVERVAYELSRPRMSESWNPDGKIRTWNDGAARVVTWALDETARIDLNAAPESMLRSLLITAGQVDEQTATALADAIADYRDVDDVRRGNGAEEADYRAADSKYRPGNAPFESVSDLGRVLGMTSEILAKIAPSLTVHSRMPGINTATASRNVLLALPGVTADQVDGFIAQRAEAIANNLGVPPFPPAQGFATAPAPVSRIHAEVTMPDGVTFVREAVVRPSMDPRRPLVALEWTEAPRVSAAAPAAASSAPQAPTPTPDAARS